MPQQFPRITQESSSQRVALKVKAKDEATEISVLDGQLCQVSKGCSTLKTELPPGIFKIVARTGGARYEEVVVLDKGEKEVRLPELKYSSPVPLSDKTPEREAAIQACGKDPVRVGNATSSSIFLFIRDPETRDSGPKNPSAVPPLAQGVAFCNAEGEPIPEFDKQVNPQEPRKTWWAKTLSLASGFYRLRVTLATGESIEQSLFAAAGWQMQIFLKRRLYGSEPGSLRPDLADATILMKPLPDARFNPDDPQTRLADLARIGLGQRRQVLSDVAFQEIILGKPQDPILRICAAHLLLLAHPPKNGKLDDVNRYLSRLASPQVTFAWYINRLRSLFPSQKHPDVEALALLLKERDVPPPIFKNPPMFRQSWSLAVEATVQNPKIIPIGSVSNRIALRVLSQGAWLLWKNPAKGSPEEQQLQLIEEYRGPLEHIRPDTGAAYTFPLPGKESYSAGDDSSSPKKDKPKAKMQGHAAKKDKPKVKKDDLPAKEDKPKAKGDDVPTSKDKAEAAIFSPDGYQPPDDRRRQQLVQTLGIPASNLDQLVEQMNQQKPQSVQRSIAPIRLEAERLDGKIISLWPRPGGVARLRAGEKFKVHIGSRRTGVITVALLGPDLGTIIPEAGKPEFRVQAGKFAVIPSLQGPTKEKAYLLVIVTAEPLATALRAELKNEVKQFPDHEKIMSRVDRVVKKSGQAWVTVGYATLEPDPRDS
jgi:hypothetical protein